MIDSRARLGDFFSEGLGALLLERFLLGVSSGLDLIELGSFSWAALVGDAFLGERFGVDFSGLGFLGERFGVDFFGLGLFLGEGVVALRRPFAFGEGLVLSFSMGNGEGT